jgi:hypothetical protein
MQEAPVKYCEAALEEARSREHHLLQGMRGVGDEPRDRIGVAVMGRQPWTRLSAKFGSGVNSVEQVPKSPIPLLATLPLHRDPGRIADFDPDAARAGSIGAIDFLRHNALCAQPASVREDAGTVVGDVLGAYWTIDRLIVMVG